MTQRQAALAAQRALLKETLSGYQRLKAVVMALGRTPWRIASCDSCAMFVVGQHPDVRLSRDHTICADDGETLRWGQAQGEKGGELHELPIGS